MLFINALIFMGIMLPIWGTISLAFAGAAFALGAGLFLFKLLIGAYALLNSIFHFSEHKLSLGETLARVIAQLISEIFSTLGRIWSWGTSVPEWFWEFARYDHPWWAFFIYVFLGPAMIRLMSRN